MLAPVKAQDAREIVGRRAIAVAAARRAVAALERKQVGALITGSLADGGFDMHSDIDFLIVECPRHMKYALEGIVEDALGGLPFDVIYIDDVAPRKLRSFTEKAVRVEDLD